MTFPLYPLEAFGYEASLVVGTLIGFAFGFVLEGAGFGRATNLAAQFYFADMRVLKVMFTAIVTAMLGVVGLAGAGLLDIGLLAVPTTHLWPQIAGGLLLGVGFIVSGYCPGTAVVAAGSGNLDGVATIGGVAVGSLLFGLAWPWVAAFHESGAMGVVRLPDLLGVPAPVLAAGVVLMAVGMFVGGEALERLFARRRDEPGPPAAPATRNRVFTGVALAALAALATAMLPGVETAAAAPRPHRELQPLALARTLVERPDSVWLVDLRSATACEEKRIPGATCLPTDTPPGDVFAGLPPTRTLVVYAEGDLAAPPAAAQRFGGELAVLRGGFAGFAREILAAPEPPTAPDADAQARFRMLSALHARFTGAAAAPPPPPPVVRPVQQGRQVKRGGGC